MLQRVHGVTVRLDSDGAVRHVQGGRDAEILRIVEEALHNAVRHAAAKMVTVRLRGDDDTLTVEVADDGIGFDPSDPDLRSHHLGLTSMEERARELGGRLQLSSAPGGGTVVRLEVRHRGD